MWILHLIYLLAPQRKNWLCHGKWSFICRRGGRRIRKAIVSYGIVACPHKLFYNVSLPVSLWFVRKEKPEYMKGKVLFVNAKDL
ncbi:N-6 DNA methylase [Archaeoglobus sulfaticallidus]|uniref:N-6 DNA methylase n=1 Tax=Archaeoglobus sulfaticallidus TaxID=1316941 RepID=UPI000693513D|nr:N-6 DNA methylase [Archaeoglobus sulfaticallidus]